MHNYHLNKGPPRCAFKIDIQKAYDTVDWKFLRDILGGFGFHPTMVGWIMTCVTSTSFSLCVNGDLHGYFKGRRGLRQASVKFIMEALEEFKSVSGWCQVFLKAWLFCNVVSHVKASIFHLVPFDEGTLPIKYLGVPLISSRLRYRDCKVLVERVQNCINDWKNKYLSFAGRLQLVMSILSSMHGYWASVFILPAAIIHEIEQLMFGFLWCQGVPALNQILAHVLIHDRQDKVCWRTQDGNLKSFSVGLAWESIRARRDNVPWFHVVWFSACIPRHAFHLWLAMGRKLKTQDKLKQWDVGTSVDLNLLRCPLCKSQPDSHDHLFFSCPYSSQVWLRITNLADMLSTLPMWDDIVDWLLPISKGNSVNSIVGRLILVASTYFVWQEINSRLFAKGERRVNELCEVIAGVVRLKLTTLHFKANAWVDKMMAVWKIANTCTNGG
ncbi:reverse transcriptase domain, reverse transcriptase zinc-binding domain protein [Tanacetum coccineum]